MKTDVVLFYYNIRGLLPAKFLIFVDDRLCFGMNYIQHELMAIIANKRRYYCVKG